MNKANELVSVIIPCYNSEKTIIKAINSVLNQTYQSFEIVIIDDGSNDTTKYIINDYFKQEQRLKYFYIKNSGGPSRPSNFGVHQSNGVLLAFLDHDDEWLESKLEEQIKILNKENLDFVSCFSYFVDKSKNIKMKVVIPDSNDYKKLILKKNFILSLSSLLIKKEVFLKIGGFDEKLKGFQDWDLYIQLFNNDYKFNFIDDYLYKTFKQKDSLSLQFSRDKFLKEIDIIFKKNKNLYADKYLKSIYFRSLGVTCQSFGDYSLAKKYLKKSIFYNRFNFSSYLFLLITLFGKKFFNFLLRIKVKLLALVSKFYQYSKRFFAS